MVKRLLTYPPILTDLPPIQRVFSKQFHRKKCFIVHFLAVCYGNSKIITIFVVNYYQFFVGETKRYISLF